MNCLAAPTLCLWMKPQDKEDAVESKSMVQGGKSLGELFTETGSILPDKAKHPHISLV